MTLLLSECQNLAKKFQTRRNYVMRKGSLLQSFGLMLIVFFFSLAVFSQETTIVSPVTSSEVAGDEEQVIVKHLPDWKNPAHRAVYISNPNDLRKALGDRSVFNLISFEGGTEAVTGNYEAGKLLIVEYSTPQFSIDADNKVKQFFAENPQTPPVYFRRVGNYEVFVFDPSSESAANELIDQVKYQKHVQWLGTDPFLYQRYERAYMKTTGDVFISTIISIVLALSFAVGTGIAAGIFVFYFRKQKRAAMTAFSDAGGMVRLNLDNLTPEISADRLLEE
jgi:hypothetical protein